MNLNKNTQINGVMYYDKISSSLVNSCDLNMSFESYFNTCNDMIKTNLNKMYSFNYSRGKSISSNGYVFTLCSYKDNRYTCSFIELKKINNE
jgi:hypothetical protein